MAALAFPASGHGRLQIKSSHVPPADARRLKKTQAKKTQKRRKKTCDSHRLEEDPAEEDPFSNRLIHCTFRTAMTPNRSVRK